ncbi:porin [Paraburkholderia sp. D1E]|uniref:porin n=1 Tax=Paraburkholderia sp. D1E TaxID=3461398 RepID=UPI0040467340
MRVLEVAEGWMTRVVMVAGVALLPMAAYAQGSVTLYGTLDSGLLYTNKSLSPTTGLNTGKQFEFVSSGTEPSVFGLAGQEDLGGGLQAKFKLESGISLANGGFDNTNGGIFGRQAWLSLSNYLGELKAGLQFSPFILAVYDTDPRSMSQFGSAITIYASNTFTGTFSSNAISYKTPRIAGFTGSFMYSLGGVPGNFQAGRSYSASLKYEYGGLVVNAAILDASGGGDATVSNTLFEMPVEGRTVGASYRFSNWTVKASFTSYKAPETVLNGVQGGGNNNIWGGGFDYQATPFLDIDAGVWYIRNPNESNNHALVSALGTTYSLSKRTALYAQVGVVNNHGREAFGLDVDGALQGPPGTTVGGGVGILHKF